MTMSVTKQPRTAQSITPDDAGTHNYRCFYIGNVGNLHVTTKAGDDVTLVNPAAGIWHGMEITRIWQTGTTATDILGGN